MEGKTTNGLREQQVRRKRVNKLKMSILTGAGIWVLILSVLVFALLVKLILLENKLDKLEDAIVSFEKFVEEQKEYNDDLQKAKDTDTIESDESEKNLTKEDVPEGNTHAKETQKSETRKVYLTFDDGPSENTSKILDILKERNIKATFFVVGIDDEQSRALYQRIVAEGHTLGMHSFSHKYDLIYKSKEAFAEDMSHLQSYLEEVTGVAPKVMRFPGGSSNQVSNVDMQELIQYVNEQGVTYFDWNVASGDATNHPYTKEELVQNVMDDVVRYETSVVLMHDASDKATTVEALVPMIDQLRELGAEILPIDETTKPIQHIQADGTE